MLKIFALSQLAVHLKTLNTTESFKFISKIQGSTKLQLPTFSFFRFDLHDNAFKRVQVIVTDMVKTVTFTELPTGELLLYIVKYIPPYNLSVYKYEGMFGFLETIHYLPHNYLLEFEQFTTKKDHFIVGYNDFNLNVIKAFYKNRKNG